MNTLTAGGRIGYTSLAEMGCTGAFSIPGGKLQPNTLDGKGPPICEAKASDAHLSNGPPADRRAFAMSSPSYVYLMRAGPYCKIGKADDIERRLAQLQTSCPEPIELWASIRVDNDGEAYRIERELHEQLADQRSSGEWFLWEDPDHGHTAAAWRFSMYGAIVSRGDLYRWYLRFFADKFARESPAVFTGSGWKCDIFSTPKAYYAVGPGFYGCVTAQWKAFRDGRITRYREMVSYVYDSADQGERCTVGGYAFLNHNGVLIVCHLDHGLSLHSASTRWMEYGTIRPGKDAVRLSP